jgi:hypothetical protein
VRATSLIGSMRERSERGPTHRQLDPIDPRRGCPRRRRSADPPDARAGRSQAAAGRADPSGAIQTGSGTWTACEAPS